MQYKHYEFMGACARSPSREAVSADQGRREFPFGNSRESATSKIPGGNSRELLNSRREFLGVYKISDFSYFCCCESSLT